MKQSNKILLFDIDDTLIYGNANVFVMKGDKISRILSSKQFNFDKLKRGETYDYREFNSSKLLNKAITTKYFETLKREYQKGNHIGILTARDDAKLVRTFLLKRGVDINKKLIFAIGKKTDKIKGNSIQERKSEAIKELYNNGYKTFIFFDDSEKNLKACKDLENNLDIKIHTVHVM